MENRLDELKEIKEIYLEQQSNLLARVMKEGGFQNYFNQQTKIEKFFTFDRNVCCIDEGVPYGTIRIAGSGIYLLVTKGIEKGYVSNAAIEVGLNAAAKILRESNAQSISSHEDCGVAKLAYDSMPYFIKGLFKNADHFGREFAEALAHQLGINYSGHIGIEDVLRPEGLHIARVVYYDGTGRFNPQNLEELPSGFVISRRYLGKEEGLKQIVLSANIAMSQHGLGELITPQNPFLLVAIGDQRYVTLSADTLKRDLENVARVYNGRVAVDGFNDLLAN